VEWFFPKSGPLGWFGVVSWMRKLKYVTERVVHFNLFYYRFIKNDGKN